MDIGIDTIAKLIQTVGFPILTASWFMFRMEKKQDAQIELLHKVTALLAEINAKVGEGN